MNQEDYVPFFDAIAGGDVAAVESFLQTPGVEVDFIYEIIDEAYLYTPLNLAVRHNHKNIVDLLLAHGASVNGPVHTFKTPLQMACEQDIANDDIIKLLLEQGADVDGMTDVERRTPLTRGCSSPNNLGIIRLLLNAGADVNGAGGEVAPLHRAAEYGNIKVIELLIEAGADVNRVTIGSGRTPLHSAAYELKVKSVSTLLAAGADPNIANAEGRTPLHVAAQWTSSIETVNVLLAAGSDPLHQDNRGRTPLQHLYEGRRNNGSSAKHFNVITALVAAGDRSWECVPTPCPGLEAAIVSVWQAAPDELPELFKRLNEEMKKVVQEVLRVLHHHFSSFPHLKEHILKDIFHLKFEEAADDDDGEDMFF